MTTHQGGSIKPLCGGPLDLDRLKAEGWPYLCPETESDRAPLGRNPCAGDDPRTQYEWELMNALMAVLNVDTWDNINARLERREGPLRLEIRELTAEVMRLRESLSHERTHSARSKAIVAGFRRALRGAG